MMSLHAVVEPHHPAKLALKDGLVRTSGRGGGIMRTSGRVRTSGQASHVHTSAALAQMRVPCLVTALVLVLELSCRALLL